MAIDLQGTSPNLQGNTTLLQGSSPVLQPAGSPTGPVYGPPAPAPAPAPVVAPKTSVAPVAPRIGTTASVQVAQPDAQINSIFSPYIGSRPSASNPGVLEYYNKQTGQGFENEQQLYSFASSLGAGVINSFSQLHAPVNSTFNPQVQNVQSANPNNQIASNAGTAGLSVDDYLKLLQQQNQITPEQLAQIQKGLGIPAAAAAAFAPPSQSTVDFYNSAYSQAGLNTISQQIQALNAQINQRQQDFINAQGTINENPFLSEASRVGRISRLNDKAQEEIGNLTQQQAQLQQLYQNGIGEVNNLVQAHTTDFTQKQEQNQANLQFLLSQATAQSQAVIAQNNQNALQYLPAYLQAKAKANPQQTVTSPTTGAIFRWDPTSGTFQTVQGPTPTYSSVTGPDGLPTAFNPLTGQYGSGGSLSIPTNTLAYRNNNPGNLRFVGQAGATQGEGGFAKFATPEAGYQAYLNQVQLDASRGLTLGQFINKYAPPSENNTSQYLQQAVSALGVSANTPLSQIDINQLAAFQLKKESGTTISNSTGASSLLKGFIRQTSTGQQYVDLTNVPASLQAAINIQANQQGIPALAKVDVDKLVAIQDSQTNLSNIQNSVAKFLPPDWISRDLGGAASNLFSQFLQSSNDISSFNAWRTAIINNVQALAGGTGSGLRINQAEIDTAMKNDLPQITDTLGIAQNKIKILSSQLSNWQNLIFQTNTPAGSSTSNNSSDPLGLF